MWWWMPSSAEALLDWCYPRRCVGCGRFSRQALCELCILLLPKIAPPVCRRCGAPQQAVECPYCHAQRYAFDEALCACAYEPPLRHAITHLKFRRWLRGAPVLGTLVVEALLHPSRQALLKQADCIVPMPIHPRRRALRGFNQAEEIARVAANALGIPLEMGAVRRRFYRRSQVGLDAEARWRNIAGAFEVDAPERIRGKFVLLLDDVFTTGSTFDACATALKAAGARYVVAVAVARELLALPQENGV